MDGKFSLEFFGRVRQGDLVAQDQLEKWTRALVVDMVEVHFKSRADHASEIAGNVVRKVVHYVITRGLNVTKPLRRNTRGSVSTPDEHFRALVWQTTRREVKALFSSVWDRRRWWPPESAADGLPDCPVFPEPTVRERDELCERLHGYIQQLRPRDRRIIDIRLENEGEGTVTEAVAREFDLTKGGASAAIKRAMERLRKLCEREGTGAEWLAAPREPWEAIWSGRAPGQIRPDDDQEVSEDALLESSEDEAEGGEEREEPDS